MKRLHEELWLDLIRQDEPPGFREVVLGRALVSARRRRLVRRVGRGALVPAILTAAFVLLRPFGPQPESAVPSSPSSASSRRTAEVVPGTSVRVINDEELLAFFEGSACGLIGPPGRRELVLLDQMRQ